MMQRAEAVLRPGEKHIPRPAYSRLLAYLQGVEDYYQLLALSIQLDTRLEQLRRAAISEGKSLPVLNRPVRGVLP